VQAWLCAPTLILASSIIPPQDPSPTHDPVFPRTAGELDQGNIAIIRSNSKMQTVLLSARRLSCYESVGCQGVTGLWHSICYMRRQGFLVGGHAESTHPQCHCPDESSNAIGSLADVLLTRFPVADQLAPGVCVQQSIYLYIYYQIQESLSTKYLHVRQFLNIRDIAMEASTGLIELYRGDNPTVEYVIHLSRHANLLTRSPALLQFTA
jgi:hypothetical protein